MKSIFLLSLLLLLSACSGTKNELKELYGLPVETIDFYKFETKSMEDLPEGFWDEEFILLTATNAEELFARTRKIRITNERIYIYDTRPGRVYYLQVYDRNGKALGHVGDIGNGPGEYIHITDFDITDNGDVFLMDAYMGSVVMHHYDADFRFISKQQLPFQADLFTCLPDGRLFFSLSTWNSGIEKNKRILVTDHNLNPLYGEMEYDGNFDDSFWLSRYSLIRIGNKISLHRPVEDNIYILNENGRPEKIYEIEMGPYRIPDEIRRDVEPHFVNLDKYKYLRDFVLVDDNYIIGKISDGMNIKMFIADRNKRICFLSKPINDSDYTYLIGYENGSFISYIESDRYIAEEEEFVHLPAEVKKHLATDNPVLHMRKLK